MEKRTNSPYPKIDRPVIRAEEVLVEVRAHQLDERLVPEHPRGVGDVLGDRVHQPVEVHPGIDLDPRQPIATAP